MTAVARRTIRYGILPGIDGLDRAENAASQPAESITSREAQLEHSVVINFPPLHHLSFARHSQLTGKQVPLPAAGNPRLSLPFGMLRTTSPK